MKKILLTLGFAAATFGAYAQIEPANGIIIYAGGNAKEFFKGDGYAYGDGDYAADITKVVKDSVFAVGDTAMYISGYTHKAGGYYIGGYTGQAYSALDVQESIGDFFTGSFATAVITADVTLGTNSTLALVLKSGTKEFGYQLSNGKNTINITDFKINANGLDDNWGYTLESITESELLDVKDIQIKLQNSTADFPAFSEAKIDNIVLTDGTVDPLDGIVDDFIATNSNVEVSAFDMMGKLVSSGKSAEVVAGLENGKVYVLRAGNNVIKIVK